MKIGVVQLTSVLDYKENLAKISNFLVRANEEGAKYIFLPECFYSMSDAKSPTPHLIEESNEHFTNLSELAKKYSIFLLGGSAASLVDGKIRNRVYNFSPDGSPLESYDKIHLFSCDLGKGKKIREADVYQCGKTPKIIQADDFKIGLGVCFDLRYPLMSWKYKEQGANLLTFSSAFTVPTGKAHWHTLLRARAIENQCYVVASAQYGKHNEQISTYGHSLVVDPWGDVLLDLEDGEKIGFCEIDLEKISQIEKRVIVRDL